MASPTIRSLPKVGLNSQRGSLRPSGVGVRSADRFRPSRAAPVVSRRAFLTSLPSAAALAATVAACRTVPAEETRRIMTVLGPIPPDRLGRTLPHEHVIVDFIGADRVNRDRYDRDDAFATVLPHLQAFRNRGGQSFVECTPAYIGRDPLLLRRLAQASGLHLITNTGYYGAVGNKYLPAHAREESADLLASRWLTEWRDGIEGTGIRPGFLKTGTDAGELSPLHEKLIRAAARAHRESGLTIAIHTGDGIAARDELRVLTEEGISPQAFIWVHAQNDDGRIQSELAAQGVWISLDGVRGDNLDRYRGQVLALRRQGLLGRVLLSQDDGWSIEGKPPGENLKGFGNPRPFITVEDGLLPALRGAGLTEEEVGLLTETNPREAFTIRRRLL